MDQNEGIKNRIDKRFKELMDRTETDPNLKKEVLGTIAKIESAAVFLDLFTVKLVKTETTLLDEMTKYPYPSNNYQKDPK